MAAERTRFRKHLGRDGSNPAILLRNGDQGALPVAEVVARLEREVKEKRIRQVSTGTAGLADRSAKYGE